MDNQSLKTGGFTLPGEAGYEDLTLRLARLWGADVIETVTVLHCPTRSINQAMISIPHSAWSGLTMNGPKTIRTSSSSAVS